jgi:hypothetical protein
VSLKLSPGDEEIFEGHQRVMQIGDVDFDTAGEDDSDFAFNGVAQPEKIVQDVDTATEGGAHKAGLGDPAPGQT